MSRPLEYLPLTRSKPPPTFPCPKSRLPWTEPLALRVSPYSRFLLGRSTTVRTMVTSEPEGEREGLISDFTKFRERDWYFSLFQRRLSPTVSPMSLATFPGLSLDLTSTYVVLYRPGS